MSGSGFGDAEKLAAARELQAYHHRSPGDQRQNEYRHRQHKSSGQNRLPLATPRNARAMNPGDDRQGFGYHRTYHRPWSPHSPRPVRGLRPPLDTERLKQPSTLPPSLIQGAQAFLQAEKSSNAPLPGSGKVLNSPADRMAQEASTGSGTEGQKGDRITESFLRAADFLAGNRRPAAVEATTAPVSQQTPMTQQVPLTPASGASGASDGPDTVKAGLKQSSRVAKFFEKRRAAETRAGGQTASQRPQNPVTPAQTPPRAATAEKPAVQAKNEQLSKDAKEENGPRLDIEVQPRQPDSNGHDLTQPRNTKDEPLCYSATSGPIIKTRDYMGVDPKTIGPYVKTSKGFIPEALARELRK